MRLLNGMCRAIALSLALSAWSAVFGGLRPMEGHREAAIDPRAVDLLKQAGDRLFALRSLSATCEWSILKYDAKGAANASRQFRSSIRLQKPSLALVVTTTSAKQGKAKTFLNHVPLKTFASDGSNAFEVWPDSKIYRHWPANEAIAKATLMCAPLAGFFDRLADPAPNISELKREGLLRSVDLIQPLKWRGAMYRVVRIEYREIGRTSNTVWKAFIGSDRLIRRVMLERKNPAQIISIELVHLKPNTAIPPAQFAFRPPRDYKL